MQMRSKNAQKSKTLKLIFDNIVIFYYVNDIFKNLLIKSYINIEKLIED